MSTPIKNHTSGMMHSYNGLRDYQIEAKKNIYAAWDEVNNVMFQMPTGTGKTVLFASIINDLVMHSRIRGGRNVRILIVAHRDELIDQISRHINKRGIKHGLIIGGSKKVQTLDVHVGSIFTVTRSNREEQIKKLAFDYIIIDEAHHSVSETYKKLWDYFPDCKKLGVTATPCRLDGKPLADLYEKLILSWPVKKFLQKKWLAQYKYISVPPTSDEQKALSSIKKFVAGDYDVSELERKFDTNRIRARLYMAYEQYVKGKKGIIYAIKIKHANNICADYCAHGVKAVSIDSKTSSKERHELVEKFKSGEIDIIVNVDIFSEGFDCPDIEFIQLARPTQSLTKYLQQVGRGLRISENKSHCVILDNVGLYERFGFPDTNRKWKHLFNGRVEKENEEEKKSNIDSSLNKTRRESNTEEGNEEMKLLQGEVEYMELDDKKVATFPITSRYDSIRKTLNTEHLLYQTHYHKNYYAHYHKTNDKFYDMHLLAKGDILVYEVIINNQIYEEIMQRAEGYYNALQRMIETDPIQAVLHQGNSMNEIQTQHCDIHWQHSSSYKVVNRITPLHPLYEKVLLHNLTESEFDKVLQGERQYKWMPNPGIFYSIHDYKKQGGLLICKKGAGKIIDSVFISSESDLARFLMLNLAAFSERICFLSDKEIWIIADTSDSQIILKYWRDGYSLDRNIREISEQESLFQLKFWQRARSNWNNGEKQRKIICRLSSALNKLHLIQDYSFDINVGPEKKRPTFQDPTMHPVELPQQSKNIYDDILNRIRDRKNSAARSKNEEIIDFGSKFLYAVKDNKDLKIHWKETEQKKSLMSSILENDSYFCKKQDFYFYMVGSKLYAVSEFFYPYMYIADTEPDMSEFIIYRPDGGCYYFSPKLKQVKSYEYHSQFDKYERLYNSKNSYDLIDDELKFISTHQNIFYAGEGYYHDGKKVRL